jgi:hypothetical protein
VFLLPTRIEAPRRDPGIRPLPIASETNNIQVLLSDTVWTIDYYNEDVRLEIEALPAGIRASYAMLTELLEEFGLELRMPQRELDIARARQKADVQKITVPVAFCVRVGK